MAELFPKKRYLFPYIQEDLVKKMVFLGGPRQVGKTTLSLQYLNPATKGNPHYLNWDVSKDQELIRKQQFGTSFKMLVLDEVHKFVKWRGIAKGFYDEFYPERRLLITGSARLDHYRKGGDSLQGRYHYYRLHPFSLNEMSLLLSGRDVESLLKFGGFPEPLLAQSERLLRRWSRERLQKILNEDLRDLERVKETSYIHLLVDELPNRVGSPLSVKNLADVLQVNPTSVERWITILENLYVVFRIAPFGSSKVRAVKKEKKLYFWDWSVLQNDVGARFENLVASQLLKYCHFIEDTEGYDMELRFLRDVDKREVDFVVLKDKQPCFAVECKSGEKAVAPALHYFAQRTTIPLFYQVHLGKRDFEATKRIRVLPFSAFCSELELP